MLSELPSGYLLLHMRKLTNQTLANEELNISMNSMKNEIFDNKKVKMSKSRCLRNFLPAILRTRRRVKSQSRSQTTSIAKWPR